MSRTRRFIQLDVFSGRLLLGNPLAVIVDAEGLAAATMQSIARWTNLSETSFLLPPTCDKADYRVRIFTPRQELPFAGHPSVGSAYVAIASGRVDGKRGTLMQECAAGLLPVRIDGSGSSRTIHVQAPPARSTEIDATLRRELASALRIESIEGQACHVDNGPHWIIADLADGHAVRSLQPSMAAIAALCTGHEAVGVAVFGRQRDGETTMAVRAFCPADGIPEDPVTGSANAAIMAMLAARQHEQPYGWHYRASQGREVGRDGVVEVVRDTRTGAISIGGQCVIGVRGEFLFD